MLNVPYMYKINVLLLLKFGKSVGIMTARKWWRFRCGYATIHDVNKKDLEDRMESFFLSETCKYLYLVSILY